jgi:DNA-binding transcriptional ArsR family regulator
MPTVGGYDYEAEETMLVSEPEQLRALADDLRAQVIQLLRDRARSTQELSEELGVPKGTVGHHLKVLERAGLIRVVRTRQVRAVTEKFYGRTARLFVYQAEDPADERAIAATMLRQAAREVEQASDASGSAHVKARLSAKDADRFERRLRRLVDEIHAADVPGGEPFGLAVAFYRRRTDA